MLLKERFLGLQIVVNLFICLLPQQMLSNTDDELFDAATDLVNAYLDDLTQDLGSQIISFRFSFKTKSNNLMMCMIIFYVNCGKLCLKYISRFILLLIIPYPLLSLHQSAVFLS
jgi:hypothetical protein